jgi:hypothetical protein
VTPSSILRCLALSCALGTVARPAEDLPPPEATEVWTPVPPVVSAPAGGVPSDAIVLFDGKSLGAWESMQKAGAPAPWRVVGGAMVVMPDSGHIRTRRAFGDIQLHLEFRLPTPVEGAGQKRGNSGVFFMERYELQILDSYRNPTYANGQAGAIYKQKIPLVNPARPPGEWQSYDVVFLAPRFAPDGKLIRPARLTAFFNGVLIQSDVALDGPTSFRGRLPYSPHPAKLPLKLQQESAGVSFRNIWVRDLVLPAP